MGRTASFNADFVVVGAGIVGAALAYKLVTEHKQAKIIVIERMPEPAQHQTGRNSGVIHAGVYYPPNSLKAQYCREGNARTISFCKQQGIEFEQCGKLLVATQPEEIEGMEALFKRCKENGLSPEKLSQGQIKQLEPNIRSLGGFKVKQSGITNYAEVCRALLALAENSGRCEVHYGLKVVGVDEASDSVKVTCKTDDQTVHIEAGKLVNCAGIYADDIAKISGQTLDVRMLPFRGEYFRLSPKFDGITQHLIYPIPDPDMPFLGVHLTKMIGGFTTVGPNAVLASGREVYQGIGGSPKEWMRIAGFSGTWKLLGKYPKSVLEELKTSLSTHAYVRKIQAYCPNVTVDDLQPFRAGIRAQAVDSNGNLIHDFMFKQSAHCLHVINAPSPAATSAMPIADAIAAKLF
jgi:L-2-hydroxyglutarate oxidase